MAKVVERAASCLGNRLSVALVAALCLSGCSTTDLSLSSIGDRTLSLLGASPVGKVVATGESVVKLSERITPEEEYYIGRAVAAKIAATYPLSTNKALTEYVERVGYSVALASDVPETFGGYHFAVLETEVPNALAAPGGFIFVTTGLLKVLPNEDALAAVLAHEVIHVVDQHGLKSISRDRLAAVVADIAKVAASINCNELVGQTASVFGGIVDDVFGTLINRGYNQEQEFSADAGGMTTMARVGFDPRQMDTVLGVMTRMPPVNEGWFQTHPGPAVRRAEVK
ncbi:MAG: hypothetical protein RL417_1832, partial [Pseudomonadota bacterium]